MILHRRSFLERLSLGLGAGLLHPIVRTLTAEAAGTLRPRRCFIAVIQSNSFHLDTFAPSQFRGGALQGDELIQTTSYGIPKKFAPLQPFRDRLLLVDGLCNQQGKAGHVGHQALMSCVPPLNMGEPADMLPAGASGGITFDQHVATVLGADTPHRSVHLGSRTGRPDGTAHPAALHGGLFARERGDSIPVQLLPTEAYRQVLLPFTPERVAARPKELGTKKRVLDLIRGDVTRVRSSLAGSERQKLDGYLASVEDASRRLTLAGGAGGASCASSPRLENPGLPEQRFSAMVDIGLTALTCGLTNVLTLSFSGIGTAFGTHLHEVGHGQHGGAAMMETITSFFSSEIARLATGLSAVREGDGSLLDQSVVMFTSNNGEYHHATGLRWPVLLLGRAGGKLKADGRYVRYPTRRPHGSLRPNNVSDKQRALGDLFSTLGHALGAPVDDFGAQGLERVKGPLSELLA